MRRRLGSRVHMPRLTCAAAIGFVLALCGCTAAPVAPNIEGTVQARVAATVAALPSIAPAIATPSPVPSAAIVLDGQGQTNTAPFVLAGDYTIDWQFRSDTNSPCFVGAYLRSPDASAPVETLGSYISVKPMETVSGQTHTYHRPSGQYYFQLATTSCLWHLEVSKL